MFRNKSVAKLLPIVLRSALGITMLFVLLYYADPYVAEWPAALIAYFYRPHYGLLTFSVLFQLLCLLTILAALWHRNRVVYWSAAIILIVMTTSHSAYSRVVQRPLRLFDLDLALEEVAHTQDALQTYQSIYMERLWIALFAIAVVLIIRRLAYTPTRHSPWVLLPLTFAVFLIASGTRNELTIAYPTVFSAPVLMVKKMLAHRYYGPREPVTIAPSADRHSKYIIFIVDESVRGDLLTINGSEINTTPYLTTLPLANFGVASSATNCSSGSNLIMRTGLKQSELPDTQERSLKIPNIFQYAQRAGYRTVYMDAQRRGGAMNDFMNRFDLDHIDTRYFMNAPRECHTSGDCFIVESIAKEVATDKPTFILAIKMGAHVPYENGYPESRRVFTPSLARGEPLRDRPRALNSYYNVVRWSVDEFFRQLMPVLEGKDYILIYTSDHGQSILEPDHPATHCTDESSLPIEGLVPLFLMASNTEFLSHYQQAASLKKDKATHYEIFPTILQLMGYSPEVVSTQWGPTLFDRQCLEQRFFYGRVFGNGNWGWRDIR